MTNPMQPLDPAGAPDPVTPAGSLSDPSGFAGVMPSGRGPAPYDIQAPMEDLSGQFSESVAASGAGVLYGQSPRQAAAEALLMSPPGYQDFDIYGGFSGQGDTTHGWPNDAGPPDDDRYTPVNTPGSPTGSSQGTGTD